VEKMKKKYYSWDDVHKAANSIALQMYKDNWRPDYIVGITRGGLPLSVLLSHMTDITMHTLDVRLRDGGDTACESNLWMAEDAFGYISELDRDGIFENVTSTPENKKNILIVDDINDTGATFNWIREDWPSGCLPDHPNWDTVWNQNVRFATMCEKTHTKFDGVDYYWDEIDTSEKDTWIVFPWEYET
jgi:hypoxanthine phosphoribosyltransferase